MWYTCGKKIKILGFVTHAAEIQRILRGIGWSNKSHEFDPPHDLCNWDICQLTAETVDGFPDMEVQVHCDIGPDPPSPESKILLFFLFFIASFVRLFIMYRSKTGQKDIKWNFLGYIPELLICRRML